MFSTNLLSKKSVDDIWPVTGKRVLIRVDFNVSMNHDTIINDYHIRTAVPTIRRIIDQGGICILMSHLGRPKGVDSERADAAHKKRQISQYFQEHRGKTSFFAGLTADDKATILSWSTRRDRLTDHTTSRTSLFAKLSEEEKKELLFRFLNENKDRMFPQLSCSAGYEQEFSLQIAAQRLAELLGQHVYFTHDCLHAKHEVQNLRCGEVMLLENLRFYTNETSPDKAKRMRMATVLASYGHVYINDAFGSSSKEAASVTEIAKLMGHGAAGYLMEREISYFSKLLNSPPRPLVAIIGGAKLRDKIHVLENLLNRIDKLIIGGGMSFPFLKATGHSIGNTSCDEELVGIALEILKTAAGRKVEVYLPIDHVCNRFKDSPEKPVVTAGPDVPDGFVALDIGPKSIQLFSSSIALCKSAVWNGPVGVFEIPAYSKGTFGIAKAMADSTQRRGLLSIIGGGDSASAAELSGEAPRMSHVSTGGMASLELLEGKTLPGIAALDDKE
ncbi:phosphoglycerate kinase [Strigomonas culicis]|uniref:Phosphoglycerate kinase n=1 Tax=Strigomonas culicis TaxID=28005 RepID=S9UIJ5_9TRYP|nr:phosphoglycerate kinase [Strigomonas culicis]|eukprot:EPY28783.1 phosphoglycerate kinase [Strigomonas culicis]